MKTFLLSIIAGLNVMVLANLSSISDHPVEKNTFTNTFNLENSNDIFVKDENIRIINRG